MPNWCENRLTIETDRVEEIQKIYDYVQENNKLFSMFDPLPEDYNNKDFTEEDLKAKYGYKDWYDWQVAHWGTKWDIDLYSIDIDTTSKYPSLTISFGTAWSPAGQKILVKILQFLNNHVARLYNLFYEPGMNFIGESMVYHNHIDYSIEENYVDYFIPSYDCFSNDDYRQLCLDEGISDDLIDAFGLDEIMYEQCFDVVRED